MSRERVATASRYIRERAFGAAAQMPDPQPVSRVSPTHQRVSRPVLPRAGAHVSMKVTLLVGPSYDRSESAITPKQPPL